MTRTSPKWKTLQQAADRARQGAAHEQAIELYTRALSQKSVPWDACCAMTLCRADSRQMLGDTAGMDAELSALAAQAAEGGDDAVRAEALAEVALSLRMSGDLDRALSLAQESLEAAQRSGRPDLLAGALCALGVNQVEQGDFEAAQDSLQAAESLPLLPEDTLGRIKVAYLKSYFLLRQGDFPQSLQVAEQELRLARQIGRRDWQGIALNGITNASTDLAMKGTLREQALAAFEEVGNRPRQAMMLGNISGWLTSLGLYERAVEVAREANKLNQAMHLDTISIYSLMGQATALGSIGEPQAALACLDEGLALARKINSPYMEFLMDITKARLLLDQGQAEEAMQVLHSSEKFVDDFAWIDKANLFAYQAAARRLAADTDQACRLADQAVGLMAANDFIHAEDTDEYLWWCYRALLTEQGVPGSEVSTLAWRALEMGLQALLEPVKNMSDAGLRRGYLHRVPVRRLLIRNWLEHGPSYGVEAAQLADFAALVQRPGRLNDVFQRLLKVGVRLNAQRDVTRLPADIVDEVAELTGGERIALLLQDAENRQRHAEVRLPRSTTPAISGRLEPVPDPDAFLAEIQPFIEEVTYSRQGFVRLLNPDAGLAQQRSLLAAPLLSQGNLVGVIYTDLSGCFGRFDPEDLDLLGVLANQSAVAVENAEWSATLENKVAERTTELQASNQSLEQRNNELAILNSVGEAMAHTLDVKTVTRIVGDKVRDIFDTDIVTIMLLDAQTNLIHTLYEFDKGEGGYVETVGPFPLGTGLTSKVIASRRPLLLGTNEEQNAAGGFFPAEYLAQGDLLVAQSWLGVPIIANDQVLGVVVLADYEVHKFNEEHIHLLQILSTNMGVAIENARLFQAEQQRVAELAIINSIQHGLAAELDFQAIIDLVGDKLRQVLHTQDLSIRWYDEKSNLLHYMYTYEHGQRLKSVAQPPYPGGPFERMRVDRRHHVWTTVQLQATSARIPGTDPSKSAISVPIISSDRVLGSIHLEDFERENAYGEAEIRLLTTIAATLGSALENAHLFEETQRLLKETEQRNSELAIINSIQQGLASELDFQAIIDLVGDKLRQILATPDLAIAWFDEKTNLLHTMYQYEHGERMPMLVGQPRPDGPFTKMAKTRQPQIWHTAAEGDALSPVIEGTDASLSGVFIPIISSDRVLGSMALENFERENAYRRKRAAPADHHRRHPGRRPGKCAPLQRDPAPAQRNRAAQQRIGDHQLHPAGAGRRAGLPGNHRPGGRQAAPDISNARSGHFLVR